MRITRFIGPVAVCVVAAVGVLMLFVRRGRMALEASASAVNQVIAYGNKGMEFMFGGLVGARMHEVFGDTGFVFAFRVLPAIVYVSALIAVELAMDGQLLRS